ncbi:GIY-YIG nuclease family protein [Candidatus Parcubacteria bacterium]|nr:GIY-YIG nuclease family protein [Patescibacteria group bacterium]MCG2694217.1 GIY-YIG nuclease family protein [Candidatus Parcubacteria bacterium]
MYYCYILQSQKNNHYYIGSTSDIVNRLDSHNKGCVRSTKRDIPWDLVYKKNFESRGEAMKKEKQIKSWKSRKAIERLISKNKIENPR